MFSFIVCKDITAPEALSLWINTPCRTFAAAPLSHTAAFEMFDSICGVISNIHTRISKDNKIYAINYLEDVPSLCLIYTMYIKGCFRSAKCPDNSIHANKKGQRSRERTGGGNWHRTQSHRYGDGAVYSVPTVLSHCRADRHYCMQGEQKRERKREEKETIDYIYRGQSGTKVWFMTKTYWRLTIQNHCVAQHMFICIHEQVYEI